MLVVGFTHRVTVKALMVPKLIAEFREVAATGPVEPSSPDVKSIARPWPSTPVPTAPCKSIGAPVESTQASDTPATESVVLDVFVSSSNWNSHLHRVLQNREDGRRRSRRGR